MALAAVIAACQQGKKQYFTDGPEIDLVKKLDQSFASADWVSFRGSYADTAKIWFNTWGDQDAALSADSLVARYQKTRVNYNEIKLGDPVIYEMVETDNGQRWVHRWGRWDVKHKNGKNISWPSHGAFLVSDGKIRAAGYIYNALPGYLANQDSVTAK